MNGIIRNNYPRGRSCVSRTTTSLSANGGFTAYNTAGYTYGDIGRLGLNLSYNHLNLVSEVGDASGTLVHYSYLTDGKKLSSGRTDGSGTVYRGPFVYSKDENGGLSLDCVITDGGRIAAKRDASGAVTAYHALHHLTDHLGSVRAVVDGDTGAVIETNDYYPFGKRIPVTSPVASTGSATGPNRWYFSGKESQSFLSADIPFLDFGARMYDPTIARWITSDPLGEKNLLNSTYSYCSGNPICIVDPFGKDEWDINKEGRIIAYRRNKDSDVILAY